MRRPHDGFVRSPCEPNAAPEHLLRRFIPHPRTQNPRQTPRSPSTHHDRKPNTPYDRSRLRYKTADHLPAPEGHTIPRGTVHPPRDGSPLEKTSPPHPDGDSSSLPMNAIRDSSSQPRAAEKMEKQCDKPSPHTASSAREQAAPTALRRGKLKSGATSQACAPPLEGPSPKGGASGRGGCPPPPSHR